MPNPLEERRDQTLRKVGRNVVNFQRLEAVLKALLLTSGAEGTLSDFQQRQAQRARLIKRQSLGNVATGFHQMVYGPNTNDVPDHPPSDGWLSVSFQLEAEPSIAKEKKRALSALVRERNRLIHKELANLDLDSIESCALFCEKLDSQNERICNQLEEMSRVRAAQKESMQEMQAFLSSEEFLGAVGSKTGDA
jgi:hypothetical protein